MDLVVREVVHETQTCASFVLEVPATVEGEQDFAYLAGQYLELVIPWQDFHIRRCYSFSSAPGVDAQLTFTVKRVEGGRASNWLIDEVRAGDTLRALPPAGDFIADPECSSRPLVAFAGGSGITPIISLIKDALHHGARPVTLVYANRDVDSQIFAALLAELGDRFGDRFTLIEHFDDGSGLLSGAQVCEVVRSRQLVEGEFFSCGPAPFMATVEAGLRLAEVDRRRLRQERFVSPMDPDRVSSTSSREGDHEVPRTICVTFEGRRHHLDYEGGQTVLETCKRHGIDAPRSCEDGYCGSCMAVLEYGDPDPGNPRALSQSDRAEGRVLTCQVRPGSSLPFAVTYDEADFRRRTDGDAGARGPLISRSRVAIVFALMVLAAVAVRALHHAML